MLENYKLKSLKDKYIEEARAKETLAGKATTEKKSEKVEKKKEKK